MRRASYPWAAPLLFMFCMLMGASAISGCPESSAPAVAQGSEVYERVVNRGVIRAAFVVQPPAVMMDPNSGEMTGVFTETLLKAAENLGLEVEWAEEVSWGTMIEGLLSDRYDIVCTQVWPTASRALHVDFLSPLYYVGLGVYVRADDRRFDGRLDAINSPDIRIATIDGEMSDIVSRNSFSEARRISLPQLSDVSQMLLNVQQGQADLTFAMVYDGERYLEANPGSVRNIAAGRPIRIFPNALMIRRGQGALKAMLDTAIEELLNQGFVDDLISEYESYPGTIYRVAVPYRVLGPQ